MENKLWFRAKRFGWGWYPVTWQGWAVIVLYVGALFSGSTGMHVYDEPSSQIPFQFLSLVVVLTIFLIIICYKTGEKPAWHWGRKNDHKD